MPSPRPAHLAALSLVVILVGAVSACAPAPPPQFPVARYQPAQLVGRRLEIHDAAGRYAGLALEADWIAGPGGACVHGSTVTLSTPSGPLALERVEACVTLAPLSLVGEADVAFPGLGELERLGVETNAPRARIALGLGATLAPRLAAWTAGERGLPLAINPHLFYLIVDYQAGLEVSLGRVALSTPASGARVVIAPQEPMIYVAGSLPGLIDDAGLGLSPAGRLTLTPPGPLFDGAAWRPMTFRGQLLAHGTVPLGALPLSVSGRLLLDLDADRDGHTALDDDPGDLAIAATGALRFGYDRAGFGFSIELGQASVAYDGARGLASFSGQAGGALFAGTPLAALGLGGEALVHGYLRGRDDFEVVARLRRTSLAGMSLADLEVSLSPRGVAARGTLALAGLGSVVVSGAIDARGGVSLRGRGELRVAGFSLVDADVELSPRGAAIRGLVRLPGLGEARVEGRVSADGSFAFVGRGALRPAGLHLADARVLLDVRGAEIAGRVAFLGSQFEVRGSARAGAGFALTGRIALNLLVLRGTIELGLSPRGARALAEGRACLGPTCVPIAGLELDTAGRICPVFPVVGRQCIKIAG